MKKIVLATSNPNKVKEINNIMKGFGVEFIMPPEGFNPIENGKTFEENALIKAKEANKLTKLPALADDSGLCVAILGGRPGIYSCRYAETPEARIQKLLMELKNVPIEKREAKFVCAMVLINAKGNVIFSQRGECLGKIGFEPRGKNGFGYDPVFVIHNSNRTMAELSEEEKNKISHRALALNALKEYFLENPTLHL